MNIVSNVIINVNETYLILKTINYLQTMPLFVSMILYIHKQSRRQYLILTVQQFAPRFYYLLSD